MNIRQGQIWKVESRLSGTVAQAVVVDSDLMAEARQRILVAPLRPAREVPRALQLLTAELPDGTAVAVYDLVLVPKNTLDECLGTIPPDALAQVKIALRARFDL
ncbi:type II toxin-antitoxin system PemK/MazF family toxin [Nocardia yamanashiensis]|uniref:type II toxin-antitoxin system PemK/MazF family toxin n=1 Tax=Nocardia yamanashiensis TaxID=209247 RepID=UPI00082A1E6A|nr:type II toxin-antitoxin system PemK/MazF family toxin [Nocardia yamanashiensis]